LFSRLFANTRSIGRQIFLAIIVPLVLFSLLFSGVLYQTTMGIINEHVITQFEERLRMNILNLNQQVDTELVQKALQDQSKYQELYEILTSFVKENAGMQNAYVIAKTNGKDVILALSNEHQYLTELPFTPEQNQALETGRPVTSDIYTDDWGVHKSLFLPLPDANAVIGIDMDASFVTDLQSYILWLSIGFIVSAIVVGGLIALMTGKRMATPIVQLVHHMKRLAEGDLTTPVATTRKDEIGQLTASFEDMRQKLSAVVQSLRINSTRMEETSSTLLQASSELSAGSNQITTTIAAEVQASEQRSMHLEKVAQMVQTVSEAISEVDQNVSQFAELSQQAQDLSQQGNEQVLEITRQMDAIQRYEEETIAKLQKLDQRSKDVTNVINIIRDIASQINLLSLNASIEAARAGENGKGFAVVAQEIQKLAKQTNDSVSHIIDSMEEMTLETEEVLKANAQSAREIEKGVVLIGENGKLFERIYESVQELAKGMARIVTSTEQISRSANSTLSSVQEITAISEETVATTEEISASTQQQFASIQQLEHMSRRINSISHELDELIKSFNV